MDIFTKVMEIAPLLVAFNVALAAISAFMHKLSVVLKSKSVDGAASKMEKLVSFIAKAIDFLGMNPKH
jgi:hypothetical protein